MLRVSDAFFRLAYKLTLVLCEQHIFLHRGVSEWLNSHANGS